MHGQISLFDSTSLLWHTERCGGIAGIMFSRCEEMPFAGHTKLCPRDASASRPEAKPGNAAVSR